MATLGRKPTLSDIAIIKLAGGKADQAVWYFTEAINCKKPTSDTYNDLGVAYLAKFSESKADPLDLILALSAFDRALALPEAGPEPGFNRALALELLGVAGQARAAWASYLKSDRDSRWSNEARARLWNLTRLRHTSWEVEREKLRLAVSHDKLQLASSIVRHFPQQARLYAEEELFGAWARARHLDDTREALKILRLISAIGTALAEVTGDRLVSESWAAITRLKREELAVIQEGHLRYAEGLEIYKRRNPGAAKPLFRTAREAFGKTKSPFGLWAGFHEAACDYYAKRRPQAVLALQELRRTTHQHGYLNLGGRVAWLLGLIRIEQAAPTQALADLREALVQFERTAELSNQASVRSLIANVLQYVAEPREAWLSRLSAISAAKESGDRARLPVILGEAAIAASSEGQHSVALALQNEAVKLVTEQKHPLAIAEAYWWRAMILAKSGSAEDAERDMRTALHWASQIDDEGIKLHTLAGISALEGTLKRDEQPVEALTSLDLALAYYIKVGYRYPLVELHLHRGQAFLALGSIDRAQTAFAACIREYESQRHEVRDIRQRVSFFEKARTAFEELVSILVSRGRVDLAFNLAERGRARVLGDHMGAVAGEAQPEELQAIRKLIPGDATLVAYYVLPRETLIWVIDRSSSNLARLPLRREALDRQVSSLLRAIVDRRAIAEFQQNSFSLYDVLLRPAMAWIGRNRRIIFVPDARLNELPFAALSDGRTGRFLIQDHALAVSPSASAYVHAARRARAKGKAHEPWSILVVGNPAFDRARFPGLAALPAAEKEANRVASFFSRGLALTRKDATRMRVLSELNRHQVIHFATHSHAHGNAPFLSSLVLASEPRGVGELTAGEVYSLRLQAPRLVVLASCSSGIASTSSLEGSSDVGRAFLAAGADSVITTLWSIDDRAIEAVLDRFYAGLNQGLDTMLALQEAQLAGLKDGGKGQGTPFVWASFQVLGLSPSVVP